MDDKTQELEKKSSRKREIFQYLSQGNGCNKILYWNKDFPRRSENNFESMVVEVEVEVCGKVTA